MDQKINTFVTSEMKYYVFDVAIYCWAFSRVFLLRQLLIVNYFVQSSSNNLSNENIKTGVSREMMFQK